MYHAVSNYDSYRLTLTYLQICKISEWERDTKHLLQSYNIKCQWRNLLFQDLVRKCGLNGSKIIIIQNKSKQRFDKLFQIHVLCIIT